MTPSDHDLLITIAEKVSNLQADVKQYNDNTASQITDHEARLRKVEGSVITWPQFIAALTTIGVIVGGLWWLAR